MRRLVDRLMAIQAENAAPVLGALGAAVVFVSMQAGVLA